MVSTGSPKSCEALDSLQLKSFANSAASEASSVAIDSKRDIKREVERLLREHEEPSPSETRRRKRLGHDLDKVREDFRKALGGPIDTTALIRQTRDE